MHVGHVHNVNNAAFRGADMTFVFTPTGHSASQRDRQQAKDKEPLCTSVNVSC